MLLQQDLLKVTIQDFVATSHKVDGFASQYMLDTTALVGWTDGVQTRRDSTARPVSDGDFLDKARKASRLITITGFAEAESSTDLHKMRDKFMGLLSDGEYHLMTVQNYAGIRHALVGIAGTPGWIQQTDTFASWKLEVYSPFPEIFGEEKIAQIPGMQLTGGLRYPIAYPISFDSPPRLNATFVSNDGNFPCWPIVVVTGDYFSGFTVTNGRGSRVTYRGPVTLSDPVSIDMGAGAAFQGGNEKSYNLTERDWFSIEPNSPIQPEFIPLDSGSGWCDIIYRDTWI